MIYNFAQNGHLVECCHINRAPKHHWPKYHTIGLMFHLLFRLLLNASNSNIFVWQLIFNNTQITHGNFKMKHHKKQTHIQNHWKNASEPIFVCVYVCVCCFIKFKMQLGLNILSGQFKHRNYVARGCCWLLNTQQSLK